MTFVSVTRFLSPVSGPPFCAVFGGTGSVWDSVGHVSALLTTPRWELPKGKPG